jgi:folate-binding protein YgfZ
MASTGTRLAAWLNAKGRVLALFDIIATEQACWLVLPEDNVDFVVQTLGRFVLRADVVLEAGIEHEVLSVRGDVAPWLVTHELTLEQGEVRQVDSVLLARCGPRRIELVADKASALPWQDPIEPCAEAAADPEAIAEGRPEITSVLRERYLPQMLNLDRLDAVSFTKGCYPGQEVVARATNLGQVKRRLQRFSTTTGERPGPAAGIVDADGEPAGEINRSASCDAGFDVLAVVRLDAPTPLRLASDGRELVPGDLPDTA